MGILDDYKNDVEQCKVQQPVNNNITEGLDNVNGYVPYEQMSPEERAQVDRKVNAYYEDTDVSAIMGYMSRLDTGRMTEVNGAMNRIEQSKNADLNSLRLTLLEDRIKKGFYPGLSKENIDNQPNEEISQLKNEISDLKKEMGDMMALLKDKLT